MHWILFIAVFVLYLSVLLVRRPEEEPKFWLKVMALYLLTLVRFNFQDFALPLGIMIGFWAVSRKPKRNHALKNLVLCFGLIFFAFSFALPYFQVDELKWERQKQEYLAQFTSVQAVTVYDARAPQQQELRKYVLPQNGSYDQDWLNCETIIRTWLLKENGIPLTSSDQVHDKWPYSETGESYHNVDEHTQLVYVQHYLGKQYFAVFKQDAKDQPFTLRLVVQHGGLKTGTVPNLFRP